MEEPQASIPPQDVSGATQTITDSVPKVPEPGTSSTSIEVQAENENDEEDDDDDFDDIFNDDDLDQGDLELDGQADVSRNYNRQQSLNSAAVQQKPKANTRSNVDDQISALSKHAAKIRLDDVKDSQDRDKDKADRATSEQVLDQRTRMILLQMINSAVISEVHGAISTGKEANVYGAVSFGPSQDGPPEQRAVKVYKTAILSFKDRERYITGEHRFRGGSEKGNNRKMVKLWAEKEFRNLRRIHSAGIACPEPFSLRLHVLVMEFLGDRRGYAFPRLRDAVIPDEGGEELWQRLYVQLLAIMRRMYQVCKLVHADLSEYNILYNKQQLYIIDVSQSVEHDHPRSLEFLRMDIKNTGDFFRRKGVDTLSDRTIFDFVIEFQGPVDESAIRSTVERLYEVREKIDDDEDAAARQEVDNEVFRNQYIPQTLEQVYDIEKDAQRIGHGEGEQLVYRNLLADQVVNAKDKDRAGSDADEGVALDSEDGSSGSGSGSGDDDDDDDESKFAKGTPRGKRFEDKESKKQHKQAVKEERREKRKEKMPKHLKKKLVTQTSRRKK